MRELERPPDSRGYKLAVTFGVNAVILVSLGLALTAICSTAAMVTK